MDREVIKRVTFATLDAALVLFLGQVPRPRFLSYSSKCYTHASSSLVMHVGTFSQTDNSFKDLVLKRLKSFPTMYLSGIRTSVRKWIEKMPHVTKHQRDTILARRSDSADFGAVNLFVGSK
jgi:hypothetical protein